MKTLRCYQQISYMNTDLCRVYDQLKKYWIIFVNIYDVYLRKNFQK